MQRWLACLMVLGLTACGSIKIRDVNETELMKVKKVAIASFSFEQPNHNGKSHAGMPTGTTRESEEAGAALREIGSVLSQKMHWTVISPEDMRANPEYKKVYDSKMKGWQTNKVLPAGDLLTAPGIMDAQSIRRMTPLERDALMAALGVDAIIEADVHITFATKGVAVMGIGNRYPQATASARMFKRGIEAPVWFDGRIVGEASSESVGKTAFWDEADVTRLGRVSAKNAFEKVSLKQEQL